MKSKIQGKKKRRKKKREIPGNAYTKRKKRELIIEFWLFVNLEEQRILQTNG